MRLRCDTVIIIVLRLPWMMCLAIVCQWYIVGFRVVIGCSDNRSVFVVVVSGLGGGQGNLLMIIIKEGTWFVLSMMGMLHMGLCNVIMESDFLRIALEFCFSLGIYHLWATVFLK